MIAVAGIAMFEALLGTAAVVSAPVLWLRGKPRSAGKLLAGWVVCLACYLLISTGIGLFELRHEHPRAIDQEVCADPGCFGVDKVDRKIVGKAPSSHFSGISQARMERRPTLPWKRFGTLLVRQQRPQVSTSRKRRSKSA